MVRNFGERRKRKHGGSNKKYRKCRYHDSPDNDYNEAGYSSAQQDKVSCREVAIYVPPRNDDSSYESTRRNNRRSKRPDYEASAKRTADYGPTSTAVTSTFAPKNSPRSAPALAAGGTSSSARSSNASRNFNARQSHVRRNNNRRRYTYYDEDEDGENGDDHEEVGSFGMDMINAVMVHVMQQLIAHNIGQRSTGGRNSGGRNRGGRGNDMGGMFFNGIPAFLLGGGAPSSRR